jgi:dTDP-4-amino-4,6-dideoxygalactose transaminase
MFFHDEVGFNYRLPNLNAALGCAQLEQLEGFVAAKRALAVRYAEFFANGPLRFVSEPARCRANYWLNAVVCATEAERDALLQVTNARGIMTRPIWRLMSTLPAFLHCRHDGLNNSRFLEARVVNLPSSVPGPRACTERGEVES